MKQVIFIVLLILGFTACSDPDGGAKLTVETIGLEVVPAAGGKYAVNVDAAGTWVASFSGNGASWCKAEPLQGEDNGVLNLTIAPNYGGVVRSTILRLGSGMYSDTLRISQLTTREDSTNVKFGKLEIPRLTGNSTDLFVQHDVTYTGKKIRNYCMEYDCTKRHARWVAYTAYDLTAEDNISRTDAWGDDPLIPAAYRTDKTDYTGYDRGHIVASNDRRYCIEANEQTFYYSNMSPQLANFNQKVWQNMEDNVKAWSQNTTLRDTLYIVKGGTIRDDQIIQLTGTHQIPVPKYYYMAVLARKGNAYQAIGLWIEHKDTYVVPYDVKQYAVSIDELEEKTGIDFFPGLPDSIEYSVEAISDATKWTWSAN